MKFLFIGDVVGAPGRKAVAELVPALRARHALDVVIANGENSAGGSGITPETAAELFAAGVDVITSGDQLGAVTEDALLANVASGVVTFTDLDVTDVHSASANSDSAQYGSFMLGEITATVGGEGGSQGWSYTLDNSNAAVQALGVGETLTETFTITVDDLVINSGAGFIVAVCGEMVRMPGLPEVPSAFNINVVDGTIVGLS